MNDCHPSYLGRHVNVVEWRRWSSNRPSQTLFLSCTLDPLLTHWLLGHIS